METNVITLSLKESALVPAQTCGQMLYHMYREGKHKIKVTCEYHSENDVLPVMQLKKWEFTQKIKDTYFNIFTKILENAPYNYSNSTSQSFADECIDPTTEIFLERENEDMPVPADILKRQKNLKTALKEHSLILTDSKTGVNGVINQQQWVTNEVIRNESDFQCISSSTSVAVAVLQT